MKLYKYISSERSDIIKNGKIRFTQFFNQNDPYECSVSLLPLKRERKQAAKDDYEAERIDMTVRTETYFSQFGMLCLTSNPKNILMWTHYADNHKGMVISFDTTNPFFNSKEKIHVPIYKIEKEVPEFGTVKPIKYVKSRKRISYGDKYHINDLFFTKSYHWEYEGEFRKVKSLSGIEPACKLESGEEIYLLDFPKECLVEIIFGLNTDKRLIEEMKSIVKSEYNSRVKLSQAKLRHLDYGIDFTKKLNS